MTIISANHHKQAPLHHLFFFLTDTTSHRIFPDKTRTHIALSGRSEILLDIAPSLIAFETLDFI